MNDKMKAEQILDYVLQYSSGKVDKKTRKEMIKEIEFMLTTD